MAIINVESLKKEYKISVKKEGLMGSFLSLFNIFWETNILPITRIFYYILQKITMTQSKLR